MGMISGGLVLVQSVQDPGADQWRRGKVLCIGGLLHPGLLVFAESDRIHLRPVRADRLRTLWVVAVTGLLGLVSQAPPAQSQDS